MPCVVTMPTVERQPSLSQGSASFNPAAAPPPPPTAGSAEVADALRTMMQGLQLSRASTLALMRMQLAVRSGERLQAMEAMDRLDTLDAELERVIARGTVSGANDPTAQIIAKHIEDQKLALAFEKLALASGIVGPGMVSIEDALPAASDEPDQAADPATWQPPEQAPDLPEMAALRTRPEGATAEDIAPDYAPDFPPHRSRGISSTVIGLILTLLIAAGIAAAAWTYL